MVQRSNLEHILVIDSADGRCLRRDVRVQPEVGRLEEVGHRRGAVSPLVTQGGTQGLHDVPVASADSWYCGGALRSKRNIGKRTNRITTKRTKRNNGNRTE